MLAKSGRWIYRYRYLVVAAWVVCLLAMLPVAPQVQDKLLPGGFSSENYQSYKAQKLITETFDLDPISLLFVIDHERAAPYSPNFDHEARRLIGQIESHPNVASVRSYLTEPGWLSDDGEMALIEAGLDLEIEDSLVVLDDISGRIDQVDLNVVMTGAPPLYRDIVVASGEDLRRSELVAFPLAVIALLLVFGTVVAAVMPAAVGGVAVAVGLGIVYYVSDFRDMSVLSFNIITLLGIGMGIDYSLFYVNRFKEELAKGHSVAEAVEKTQGRAGTAILFSGVTSVIGLASLLLFDLTVLDSIGIGAVIVITIALLSAQTLMPAVLSIVGHRINKIPVLVSGRWSDRMWLRMADEVMRRPLLFLIPTVVLLVALAVPFKDIRPGTVDATILPKRYESRQGFDLLQEKFGWDISTELTVAYTFEGDPFSEDNLTALYDFGKALENLPTVNRVSSIVNLRPTLGVAEYRELYTHPEAIYDAATLRLVNDSVRDGIALFYVSSDLHPFTTEAQALVDDIRGFDALDKPNVYVDGGAAQTNDLIKSLYSRFPIVAIIVILLTFVSLMVLFRSIVIPLKAVVLNVLSILASFGALVWIFQQGNLSGVLDFEPLGVIDATTPIVLFAILFGLSMDYEIFLLSRVREAYLDTGSNRESVKLGLQRSGTIITGAGLILIVVGASFVLAEVVAVKMVGFGLALAVFIDVTIVRILIAPALMRLFGRWNWWLPHWLDRRLPRLKTE